MSDPVQPAPRGRSASFWVALVLTFVLGISMLANLVLLVAVAVAASAAGDQPGKRDWSEKTIDGEGETKIALIEVRGVITDDRDDGMFGPGQSLLERVKSQLKQARDDAAVKAVVLAIESPGGGVTASDDLHDAVKAVRAAGKPVVAHMGALCASGGYYISAATERIVAAPTSITGSIGVIMQIPSLHRLLDEKLGVSIITIKAGEMKDALSPFRPMRDQERALFQAMADEMHARFIRVVAAGRAGRGPIPAGEAEAEAAVRALADGRIYTGDQALANGLADEVGHVEAAWRAARELAGAPTAKIVRYRRQGGLFELFEGAAESRINVNAGVQVDAGSLRALTAPRIEWRWAPEL